MKKILACSVVFGMFFLGGCSQRIADLTFVSTKSFSQEELATAISDNGRVIGEDYSHIIILFPIG